MAKGRPKKARVSPRRQAAQKKARVSPRRQAAQKKAAARKPSHLRFPCISFKQENNVLVLFRAAAKELWSVVKVNRRAEDKDEGYQRTLSPSRVRSIRNFINDKKNVLPTSVLISLDKGRLLDNGCELSIPNVPDAGWVIDGQHRLAGAHEAERDISLPVVAFLDMSLDEQINCFVTINREQKGVPSSLYYELLKSLPGSKTEKQAVQERAADLGKALKADEASPFYAKIVSTTSPKTGQLSLTNFVRKVSPLVKRDGRLASYSDDERQGILNNLYKGLSNVFPHEYAKANSIFFRTLGFGAMLNALHMILDITLQHEKSFTASAVTSTLRRVAHFDFKGWHEKGTGTAAESMAANDLITELTEALTSAGTTKIVLD